VPTLTRAQLDRLIGALVGYFMATLVAGLLGSLGAVSMSWVALADRAKATSLSAALRAGLRRTIDVLVFMLITGAVVVGLIVTGLLAMALAVSLLSTGPVTRGGPGVFLALVIGVALAVALVFVTVRWALAFPALAAEPLGWRGALSRSWRLSHEHVWRILVVLLAGGLVTVVVGAFVSQVAAIILVDVLATAVRMDPDIAESFALAFGTILLAPLMPLLLSASYRHLVGTPEAASDGSGAE
jgi:membrane-anchored glycerophosphoryl diester phosphodiesterase (GDPDase)